MIKTFYVKIVPPVALILALLIAISPLPALADSSLKNSSDSDQIRQVEGESSPESATLTGSFPAKPVSGLSFETENSTVNGGVGQDCENPSLKSPVKEATDEPVKTDGRNAAPEAQAEQDNPDSRQAGSEPHDTEPAGKTPGEEVGGLSCEPGPVPGSEDEGVINTPERTGCEDVGITSFNNSEVRDCSLSRSCTGLGFSEPEASIETLNKANSFLPPASHEHETDLIGIATEEDLNLVRDNLNGRFKLLNDLNLTGSWIPIGSNDQRFSGIFDGQGFTVSSLFIGPGDPAAGEYAGFFGATVGATIKNLNLVDVDITGTSRVGGLVGCAHNTRILNCSVRGSVEGSGDYVGGLAGSLESGHIGTVPGGDRTAIIAGSSAECTVTGSRAVGGLVGWANSSNSSSADYDEAIIENSYARGEIRGDEHVGGMAGFLNDGARVINCYSVAPAGPVTSAGDNIGGLVGFAKNRVINDSEHNFWFSGGCPVAWSALGTGLDQDEMRRKESFTGWCFEETWYIGESLSSPVLSWQREADNSEPEPGPEPGPVPDPGPEPVPQPKPQPPVLKPGTGWRDYTSPAWCLSAVTGERLRLEPAGLVIHYLEEAEELLFAMLAGTEEVSEANLGKVKKALLRAEFLIAVFEDILPSGQKELILDRLTAAGEALESLILSVNAG